VPAKAIATGVPTASAMCIGPEWQPMSSSDAASSAAICGIVVAPASERAHGIAAASASHAGTSRAAPRITMP